MTLPAHLESEDELARELAEERALHQQTMAERDRLREALEDLCERQYDFPTDLSRDREWARAFDRAREVLSS
jgi:hypothetical protein